MAISNNGREVLSHHPFRLRRLRLWLPLMHLMVLVVWLWIATPQPGPVDVLGLVVVLYATTSVMVSLSEVTVLGAGLLVRRLALPERFVPWNAIDRVIVYAPHSKPPGQGFEFVSIGLYEGLSPLNRLPGVVYGQGARRQTVVVTSDTVEDYPALLVALAKHCRVERR
jgi:hypothetical protein